MVVFAIHSHESAMGVHVFHIMTLPPHPIPQGHPSAAAAAAAAAKSLQSCPTLCDPIDGSPPGSSVHGIFQARVLEWGAIPALNTLPHASNLDWRSISHMIIYIFQCYPLKSSHPHLLLQSPKVCSLHLCLFCCLKNRVIITVFLNSIYIR